MKRLVGFLMVILIIKAWAQKPAELSSDYQRFNLNPNKVEKWEDGTRTKAAKGTYEWWYFDFKMYDGTTIVTSFLTKPITNINTEAKPFFFVDIVFPDGKKITHKWEFDPIDYYAATDSCYVQMGKSYIKGNLKKYVIHIDENELKLDIVLKNLAESWRPKTGHLVFDYNKFFAWLVAVPYGEAEAKLGIQGKTKQLKGSGYHDHNWGNAPMDKLIHHWYWSRTQFNNFAVIAANVVAEKQFGYKDFTLFAVFKNGKIVADVKTGKVKFYQSTPKPYEGKPISKNLLYVYNASDKMYFLWLNQKQVLSVVKLIETLVKNPALAKSLQKAGYDATYYRMTGNSKLMIIDANNIEKHTTDKAIWEIMYFGKD